MLVSVEKELAVAKVDQLDTISHVDQDVLWLEVLVAHTHLVVY